MKTNCYCFQQPEGIKDQCCKCNEQCENYEKAINENIQTTSHSHK